MRRTLKLLLLFGIGLAMAKNGPGGGDPTPGGTPEGNGDSETDPVTGLPEHSQERKDRLDYDGTDASQDMPGVHAKAKAKGEAGRAGDTDGDGQPNVDAPPTTEPRNPDKWASQGNLDNHYRDHGEEMGFESQIEYREAAIDLMSTDGGRRPGVQIKRDGEVSYFFDPATGEFGASGPRGIITYFTPDNPADYFNRQPGTEV